MHKPQPKYGWYGQVTTFVDDYGVTLGSRVYHKDESPAKVGEVIDGPKISYTGNQVWVVKWIEHKNTYNHTVGTLRLLPGT